MVKRLALHPLSWDRRGIAVQRFADEISRRVARLPEDPAEAETCCGADMHPSDHDVRQSDDDYLGTLTPEQARALPPKVIADHAAILDLLAFVCASGQAEPHSAPVGQRNQCKRIRGPQQHVNWRKISHDHDRNECHGKSVGHCTHP
jgi:hypothetical protein